MKYLIIKGYKSIPTDLTPRQMLEAQLAEMKALRDLGNTGRLERVWKVPGSPGKSVWLLEAQSHEEIDRLINGLPDFPYFVFDIRVIPLSDLGVAEQQFRDMLQRNALPDREFKV